VIVKDKSFFKYKIPNYKDLKKELIDLIYKSNFETVDKYGEKVSFSDFEYSKDFNRQYVIYIFDKIIEDFSKEFCKTNNCKSILIQNIWFQIYKTGDFHSIHTHPMSNFTNIVYIDIPMDKIKTNVYSLNKDKIDIEIKEGDILTFPAFFPHESPVNDCKDNKIVVSFNSSIEDI